MTATDDLRRLLDERDEYYGTAGNKTWWGRPIDAQTGKPINVFHNFAQPMGEDRLYVELQLATPEQAVAATLGRGTCKEVYLHMATDIGEGKEEVLGVYATESAAIEAINDDPFGYAFHHVRKWEVDE